MELAKSALADDAADIAEVRATVTRYATAWLACYHDAFTLHYAGQNPLAGTHRGKAKALAVLAEAARRANRKLLGVDDIMAGPRRGAVLVRESFSRDGRTATLERLLVYAVRDGLLSECWVYDRDQATVDAFFAD
jgi:ketosteroid isomerase-like protein